MTIKTHSGKEVLAYQARDRTAPKVVSPAGARDSVAFGGVFQTLGTRLAYSVRAKVREWSNEIGQAKADFTKSRTKDVNELLLTEGWT